MSTVTLTIDTADYHHPLTAARLADELTTAREGREGIVIRTGGGKFTADVVDVVDAPLTVWTAVVEFGEDYGDREPGVTVARTEAAARAGAAAEVWDFLNAVADPEPCMVEFMAEYGDPADAEDPAAWLDALRCDSDVPAFITIQTTPIV